MGKIILVTGGARSGKSRFAEEYAARCGQKVAYVATAEIRDEEMAERVRRHIARRPADWRTYEAPHNAHLVLREAIQSCDTVLFDCLTVYMSNILLNLPAAADYYAAAEKNIRALLASLSAWDGRAIFVTNEVGAGIVPDNKLARDFRDMAGMANQMMGQAAAEVYLVTCGMAVDVKKLAINFS